jgi:hypothetical protein
VVGRPPLASRKPVEALSHIVEVTDLLKPHEGCLVTDFVFGD